MTAQKKSPKVALVCDWLTNMGGAEKLLLSLHQAYPDAPIYTSVFEPTDMPAFAKLNVRTTYLQHLPRFLRRKHQLFSILRTRAFRKLDLSDYDVVLSVASAEAKAVQARHDALHICYCHTPTRYYWSHYEQYKRAPGFGPLNPLARLLLPLLVPHLQKLDLRAVAGVDYFIANSTTVAERISRFYGRRSEVIHPPVDMARFRQLDITDKRSGFVTVGRQVPYKRIDLAVQACTQLGLPLTVYGTGSERTKLMAMAGESVKFITDATDRDIAKALSRAEGFLFPAEEDFGIVQVEAMAAGCPVIAYGTGGSLDAVIDGETGVFFADQTVESLTEALLRFASINFSPKQIQKHAEQFSEERFIKAIRAFVDEKLRQR